MVVARRIWEQNLKQKQEEDKAKLKLQAEQKGNKYVFLYLIHKVIFQLKHFPGMGKKYHFHSCNIKLMAR